MSIECASSRTNSSDVRKMRALSLADGNCLIERMTSTRQRLETTETMRSLGRMGMYKKVRTSNSDGRDCMPGKERNERNVCEGLCTQALIECSALRCCVDDVSGVTVRRCKALMRVVYRCTLCVDARSALVRRTRTMWTVMQPVRRMRTVRRCGRCCCVRCANAGGVPDTCADAWRRRRRLSLTGTDKSRSRGREEHLSRPDGSVACDVPRLVRSCLSCYCDLGKDPDLAACAWLDSRRRKETVTHYVR